jgi:glycosyltransferase involved in cell wall biosynthesis
MMDIRKRRINILYFAPCGLGEGVGGGARLRNMIDVLGQLETNTHLISYLPRKKFMVKHEQITDHLHITTVSVNKALPKFLKAPSLALTLIYGLRPVRQSNMLFAHSPSVASGFLAFILAKIFGKPLLIDHMDIKDPDTPRFVYQRVLKGSDVVFTISRYLEGEAKGIGCKQVVYLPVFVDADVFKKDTAEGAKIRNSLGMSDRDTVIGYAGSFSHIEGLPFLLKGFKNLSSKHENIKLVIVGGRNVGGSDDVAQLVSELALNRAILVPPQPHELMPQYLSAFDIACSPKIDCAENRAANPIKIYEYMSMALPTVLSAVGEPANVIENGIDGFLVKPGDENDLEKTLEYVIQNLDSAKEVGERAREKIIKNYTQQVMMTRVDEALKHVLRKEVG